ncbi:helix-turn-helix domain-containing protein [Nostocaceae cyanobacterium CENA357]|uniref:Helix-turn-helix domain-containing protein n=1 Tax=Atlanticothrix silvestris CENA357 TaxID=1725252 RepID=A0A8J7L3U1_9CYAN|nr:helix-turn-helix domain-containing protein [Atlanticothrix silvestris]MBH8552917.1 helix-turn-helix domain-containing protein [Atlanticothrix silvestris CENA357]
MSKNINSFQTPENYQANTSHFLTPFQKKILLKNVQANLQPEYRRRIEIMLLADQGKSPTQICKILGCSYHMARYWSGLAKAGLAHQWQEQQIGRPKSVNEQYLERLKELVSHSPREYGYPFKNWTAQWLSKHLASEIGIEITDRHISRLLKQMGLSTRQTNNNLKQKTDDNQDFEIMIDDLQLSCESNSFQLPLNFINANH